MFTSDTWMVTVVAESSFLESKNLEVQSHTEGNSVLSVRKGGRFLCCGAFRKLSFFASDLLICKTEVTVVATLCVTG